MKEFLTHPVYFIVSNCGVECSILLILLLSTPAVNNKKVNCKMSSTGNTEKTGAEISNHRKYQLLVPIIRDNSQKTIITLSQSFLLLEPEIDSCFSTQIIESKALKSRIEFQNPINHCFDQFRYKHAIPLQLRRITQDIFTYLYIDLSRLEF